MLGVFDKLRFGSDLWFGTLLPCGADRETMPIPFSAGAYRAAYNSRFAAMLADGSAAGHR